MDEAAVRRNDSVIVVGLSGKRGSGKDFFGALLKKFLEDTLSVKVETRSLANSFKGVFAAHAGLSFERLLNDREYKETHRREMNAFFSEINKEDPFRWGRHLMQSVDEDVRVVIVTDVRLQTDIVSLQRASADKANATGCAASVFYVRIHCTDEIRQRFGWKFDEAVDRHFTETNLDDFTAWDYLIENEGTLECLQHHAAQLYNLLKEKRLL